MESTRQPVLKSLNRRLLFVIVVTAVGSSFQHGYNTGVVNAPQQVIEDFIRVVLAKRKGKTNPYDISQGLVTALWAVAVAIYCVGGIIGGALVGLVAKKLGRKGGLFWNNIFVFVAALLQGFSYKARSFELIILGRLIIGINCGLNAGLAPMYLTEISPVNLRGAVGSTYQLVLTISILISQVLGQSSVLGNAHSWHILLAITVVPALIMVVTLPFCPESPKYLLAEKSKEEKAQKALTWLRGKNVDVQDEMGEMRAEKEESKLLPKVTMKEMWVNRTLRIPLIIAVGIMIAQQFSGINAVIFYSTDILKSSNLEHANAQLATMVMGLVNVLMTVVSMVLVEEAGRKTLLILGFGGMFIDTILLTIGLVSVKQTNSVGMSYFCITFVLIFVSMFAIGPGSIPWFLVNELFNQSARPTASSIAVTTNWTANFLVSIGFPLLKMMVEEYCMVVFAVFQLLTVLFVCWFVPETKQRPIAEIVALFSKQTPHSTAPGPSAPDLSTPTPPAQQPLTPPAQVTPTPSAQVTPTPSAQLTPKPSNQRPLTPQK